MHDGWGVQLLILLVQKSQPLGSGSRFRKSRYCCFTKNRAASIGFGPSARSLSVIATVAVAVEPSDAPDGLLRLTVKVSGPSRYESSMMSTEMVLAVSPAANFTVANR